MTTKEAFLTHKRAILAQAKTDFNLKIVGVLAIILLLVDLAIRFAYHGPYRDLRPMVIGGLVAITIAAMISELMANKRSISTKYPLGTIALVLTGMWVHFFPW